LPPKVGALAVSNDLEDKRMSPYYVRLNGGSGVDAGVAISILQRYGSRHP
jgi:hypothetical protein